MSASSALTLSRLSLTTLNAQVQFHYRERIPASGAMIVVSNHRSFMDVFVLMAALERPIRFACHRYMGQTPILREVVSQLGCFPLAPPPHRQKFFLEQASQLLHNQEAVGIFPEGAEPMLQPTASDQVGTFQRGFAHLAFRWQGAATCADSLPHLAVLPVAIAATKEWTLPLFPLPLLSIFDASEPLFQQDAWHPVVLYRQVDVRIGHPYWIDAEQHRRYHGKHAKGAIADLVNHCHSEITQLLY